MGLPSVLQSQQSLLPTLGIGVPYEIALLR